MIIQCDSGLMTGDLIACARYRIYDLKAKAVAKETTTHVLFVIHLPRNKNNSSFVGFQGDPWVSFHIDDLRPTSDVSISVKDAISMKISELFIGNRHKDSSEDELDLPEDVSSIENEPIELQRFSDIERKTTCNRRLHGCIQAAASKLKDTTRRCTERLTLLVRLIPEVSSNQRGECNLCDQRTAEV